MPGRGPGMLSRFVNTACREAVFPRRAKGPSAGPWRTTKVDVLVIGGGNAAVRGADGAGGRASVMVLEAAPREWRGGKFATRATCAACTEAPQDVLVDATPREPSCPSRILTGDRWRHRRALARLVIRASVHPCRPWMRRHGLIPALAVGGAAPPRTNAFFMGGGKGAGQRLLPQCRWLVAVRYRDAGGSARTLSDGRSSRRFVGDERIEARACVLPPAASNPTASGCARPGASTNEARPGRQLPDPRHALQHRHAAEASCSMPAPTASATRPRRTWWPSMRAHRCTTAASAPASTACRWAWWSTCEARRFYDEGEDFWPKRYAIWGRLVAQQPGQVAWSIIDAKAVGVSCHRCSRAAPTACPSWRALGPGRRRVHAHAGAYNAACRRPFDHTRLDDCVTQGLVRRPRPTGPGRSTRHRYTATGCGPASPSPTWGSTDEDRGGAFRGRPSPNLFVAGEMMAGNVLGRATPPGWA